MLTHSLTARIVGLVLAVVVAGQFVLGYAWIRDARDATLASGRAQLALAERLVAARVAQARADAQSLADQLSRDTVLSRASAQGLQEIVSAQLLAGVRKLGNARGMLVRHHGQVVADVAPPSAVAPIRVDYWPGRLRPAFAVGRASGFVEAGGATVMWTAVPSGFEASTALVIVQPIEAAIAAEFARSGVNSRMAITTAAQGSPSTEDDPLVRRVFVDANDGAPVAVELRLEVPDVVASWLPWLPVFGFVAALSALAAFALCRRSLRPIDRLREAIAAQTVDNLRPLEGPFRRGTLGSLVETLNKLFEQVQARDKALIRRAFRDPLTALPNRALLSERLTLALRDARKTHRSLAVLLIDIERFDVISESLGAAVADAIVSAVAARLKSTLREADSLLEVAARTEGNPALARVAGNRFAIALPGCNAEQATMAASRIVDVFRRPVEHEGREIDCRVTIGVATFPAHAEDADGLVRAADIALRWARQVGEPVKVFSAEQEREREFQISMAIELQKAMDNGTLTLQYQPKIGLRSGVTTMAEALLRWNHPERGLVDPSEFISFAERVGLIARLSRWVVDQGLAQIANWRASGVEVQLAINVSLQDLTAPHFAAHLIERLRHYQLPASTLTIEISESSLVQRSSEVLENMQVLDRFGIKLGIDDFGAGYAALAYLRTLPVDHVKIDRRFVLQMATDRSAYVIVAAAVRLAHSLKWRAVAEGVEDAETMRLLRDLGCDHAQGFYLGKPLDADNYLAWLRHQSRRFDTAAHDPMSGELGEPASSVRDELPDQPPGPPVGVDRRQPSNASGTLTNT